MGLIGRIYNFLAESSPIVEVTLRKIYWRFVSILSKYSTNKTNRIHRTDFVDFEEIVNFLKSCGIGEGDIIVLHSSYGNLKPTSLNNIGIINRLLNLVGEDGTLAAPVIRTYEEESTLTSQEQMKDGCAKLECLYDIDNTPISSGVLPITLKNNPQSVTSEHPINPLTAVGKYAEQMMCHNIEGDAPSGHGPNSCWKFCADHNAYIVYLGVDFGHHLTMQQVVSESYEEHTPKNFFFKRRFVVQRGGEKKIIWIKERRRCMTKYLPERCIRKDVLKSGIFKTTNIKGIPVSVVKSKDFVNYFTSRRKYYPYYFLFRR